MKARKVNPLSMGGALISGVPVCFTSKDKLPELVYKPGTEKQALELLAKMGIVKLLIYESN